jgi:hypothetical protein
MQYYENKKEETGEKNTDVKKTDTPSLHQNTARSQLKLTDKQAHNASPCWWSSLWR